MMYCTTYPNIQYIVKFLSLKFFVNDLFQRKLNTQNILCNVCQPIPIFVTEVWRRNLDYAKIYKRNILLAKVSQSTVT